MSAYLNQKSGIKILAIFCYSFLIFIFGIQITSAQKYSLDIVSPQEIILETQEKIQIQKDQQIKVKNLETDASIIIEISSHDGKFTTDLEKTVNPFSSESLGDWIKLNKKKSSYPLKQKSL